MSELFKDPKSLVKDLSTVIIDSIWTYSVGRFKKDLFPKDKRYELIKNIKVTNEVMIFETLNDEELKKVRAKFEEHKFIRKLTPFQYTKEILNKLQSQFKKKVYQGSKGFYEITEVSIIRNEDGGYTITLNYKFYDVLDTYFSILNADVLTLIIIQFFRSIGRNYYDFTKAKRLLFEGVINHQDESWEYILSLVYPKFHAYVKKMDTGVKDNLWWLNKFLGIVELSTAKVIPEGLVEEPKIVHVIDYAYSPKTQQKLDMISYLENIGITNFRWYDSEAEFRAMSY